MRFERISSGSEDFTTLTGLAIPGEVTMIRYRTGLTPEAVSRMIVTIEFTPNLRAGIMSARKKGITDQIKGVDYGHHNH